VYASDIIAVVAEIAGVLSVDGTATQADDVTPCVGFDLTISTRQVATIANGDITVTSTGV
jgi:hypothetical protein